MDMMDWDQMSVSRDRILSDSGDWNTALYQWKTTPPRTVDGSETYSYRSSRLYRRTWDVVVPNWKAKVSAGEIITNDFLDFSLQSTYAPLEFQSELREPDGDLVNYQSFRHYPNVDLHGDGPFPVPEHLGQALAWITEDSGSLRSEAVTTAFSRVDVSELEMLASLGEMPETVDWFRDVLKRLIAAMAMLKKRQYLDVLNQLKTLKTRKGALRGLKGLGGLSENTWMEWRYAIRPLIFEVKSYLAALDSKIETATRKTARSRITCGSHSELHVTAPSNVVYRPDVRTETSTFRSVSAGVLYSLDPELTGWWTHLGLDAPISAAWAVTRLSFVLDWFFNIGQWIASWEPRLGLTPLTSWVVETRTVEIKGVGAPVATPHPNYTILSRCVKKTGGYSCKVQVKARWANPNRQILPTFNYRGLNTAKVADLVVIGRKLASQLLN